MYTIEINVQKDFEEMIRFKHRIQKDIFRQEKELKKRLSKLQENLQYQIYCNSFDSELFQKFPLDVKIMIYKDLINSYLFFGGYKLCLQFYYFGGHLYTCSDTREKLRNHQGFQNWIYRDRRLIWCLDFFCFDILNSTNIKRFARKSNAQYTTKTFKRRLVK